jgi:hypothetical protein
VEDSPAVAGVAVRGIGYAYCPMDKEQGNGEGETRRMNEDQGEAAPAGDVTIQPPAKDRAEALRRAAEAVWVAAQKGAPWASLAVLPAEPGLRTGALARAVAEVGSVQRGEPVEYLDLQSINLAASRPLAETLADESRHFQRVVALGCPSDDRVADLLASSAAAAVLIVERDATRLAAARRVLEIVGPERFLGAVVLEPAG